MLRPFRPPTAYEVCNTCNSSDVEGWLRGGFGIGLLRGRQEGEHTVVEIGEQEDFAGREGIKKGRLVYTIERARLQFTDPTRSDPI